MINLHLHTNCSDGILEPIELLKKLESNGIKIASITDHDTISAYEKLKDVNINEYYSGVLIPGVEIKCNFRDIPIEIVGINIDVNTIKSYLENNKKKINDFQRYAYYKGIEVCKRLGLKYDEYEIKDGQWAGLTTYNLLMKYYEYNIKILNPEIFDNPSLFYRQTFSNINSPFFVSEESLSISVNEVINKVHECGGIAFLAHIGQYTAINDKIAYLDELVDNTKLDGIECYYLIHTEEETNKYLDYCHKHNLLISGGSDYHGTDNKFEITQPNIDINELTWLNELKVKNF